MGEGSTCVLDLVEARALLLLSIFQASWPRGFQPVLSQPHTVPQMCWGYRCSPLFPTGFLDSEHQAC